MSVRLFVKDNTTGQVHEYGTGRHDALILQEDGSLHYMNMHNSCGTMFPVEGYSFCFADGTSPDYKDLGCDSYIDIGGDYCYADCYNCKHSDEQGLIHCKGCIHNKNYMDNFNPIKVIL